MQDPLIGRTLKQAYHIENTLADGGMGMVYLAEQLSLGRKVVLKVLRSNFNDDDFIDMFLREARINSQLNHPNVVSVFDFGKTDDGITFLAMEYLQGSTLSDIVTAANGLSLAKTLWVMEQICSAVHAAHKLDIVHRDLKPNNVMVSAISGDNMMAKILDFGISKPLAEKDLKYTQMGMVMGTPAYLAPEQIMGQRNIDVRADIYALGAILYFAVSGRAPYKGGSSEIIMNKQLTSDPLPLTMDNVQDRQSLCLVPVIRKAMAKEREERFSDVNGFWHEVLNHAKDFKQLSFPGDDASSDIPHETTRYQVIFSGHTLKGADTGRVRDALKKVLKVNSSQADALFSGRRVIIRKNLPKAAAEKMRTQLGKMGAISTVEAMGDATRIIQRNEQPILSRSLPGAGAHSLPSVGLVEAISFNDIQAASALAKNEPVDDRPAVNPPSRAPGKQGSRLLMTIAVCATCAGVAAFTFFTPVRHYLSDTIWYGVKGNVSPRGVSSDVVRIGMSAALSGSAREIGQSMRVGINTYFHVVNQGGGVNGRQLKLVDLDDGYEPGRAIKNLTQFVHNESGVFALLGNVGTPTAAAILPTVLEEKILQFGTFSGAPLLRKSPPDRYVFNYRASYAEETYALIQYFIEERELAPHSIGVFYQNDSFGLAGLHGVEEALHQYKVSHHEIIKAHYERNTAQVDHAVQYFANLNTPLDAIVMVSTYAASATFIHHMRNAGYTGAFANVSFVGSLALLERLTEVGQSGEGIIVSQVVPPYNAYATGVLKYREALKKYFPGETPNFISLEGYIIAAIFTEALRRSGRHFDTETVVNALETIKDLDLGIGTAISFSLSDHQGSHRVWGTVIDHNYEYQPIELSND